MEQLSQQQSIYNQMRKLLVRPRIVVSWTPMLTKRPVLQVILRHANVAQGRITRIHRNARLMHKQKLPMTKRKIEAALARLDKLGSGKNEDTVNAQDLERRVDMFTSVISTPPESILY